MSVTRKYRGASSIINELVDTVSKNANLLLNISQMGDASIPEEQQRILLEISLTFLGTTEA